MLSYNTAPADLARQLDSGETLIWNGRPKQGILLRPSDALLIPFSLLWAGFVLFWEAGVITSGAPLFFMLWGIPFLMMGAYLTVGRFFIDAYVRSKTCYGLTNERVLIVAGLFSRTVRTVPLQTLGEISLQQYADGSGTITFGPNMPFASWYRGFSWPGMDQRFAPTFERIPDAKHVYDLVRKAQQPG